MASDNPFAMRRRKYIDPFALRHDGVDQVHIIRDGVRCGTDERGFATPHDGPLTAIVLEASPGFIPLWDRDVTLHWKFRESSFLAFSNPSAAKAAVRQLMVDALALWGDAVPVRFRRVSSGWDFEVVMLSQDDCNGSGCVLAEAFFPDAGRHPLQLFPILFGQSRQEQVETLAHELGHVFGLRHFFAQITETSWKSEIFGTHDPFSIMNYGANSVMTANDRADLKRLYQLVWSGQLTKINGTPIKLVRPFHSLGPS